MAINPTGDFHMAGENTASGEAKTIPMDDAAGEGRERSTIGFPYNNLADAIDVARAIHSNVGTGDCDDAQLSAWMNMSPKSSGYRVQLSASRMFGLIETTAGRHRLSGLGRTILDPQREREAKVRAFTNVPLYSTVYEKYKGGVLPPAAAFERDIVGLGVAEKQKERARQVFEKSAEQAGFFESGRNRLVAPGIAARDDAPGSKEEKPDDGKPAGGGGGGDGPTVDPIIQGLLARLPKTGQVWPENERKLWLQLLEGSFKLIYKEAEQKNA
jgi:hypothetical protein